MARIELHWPGSPLFTVDVPVRIDDINYGGHLGNDSVLTLLHEARMKFFRHLGFESEAKLEGTVGQIMTDVAIVYKSESFYGDVLQIELAVADHNKYGFDFLYRVTSKTSGKEVALAKTGSVCFDYQRRKVVSVPAVLLDRIR